MEIKYKHSDFNKILDAFINIKGKGSPENLTSEDIKPLLGYPEAVLKEFIRAIKAFPEETVDRMATDASVRSAAEIYILIRMNLVKLPTPSDW